MELRKPVWTTSSFVLYVGGLTVLLGAAASLAFLSSEYGNAAFVGWTLLPLAVLWLIAHAFRRRGEWIPAGLFIVADFVVWLVFLGALLEWWGWAPDDEGGSLFAGWHWGLWLMIVVALVTAFVDLRQFRFPLLAIFPTALAWFLFVDLLSGGGDWARVLTLFAGLVYLGIGGALDGGASRPYGFWVHVVAGVLIGATLLQWWSDSDTDWSLVAATGVVFVGVARVTRRSSWAVLGMIGFLAAATYFVGTWSGIPGPAFLFAGGDDDLGGSLRLWVPGLVYGIAGLFLVLLGRLVRGREAEPAP